MNFSDLYASNIHRLQRLVSRMLGSANDAADIAHDAFLRAYVAELGNRTELSGALLTVTARRLALNEIRNRTRRATDAVGDLHDLGVLSSDDPGSHYEDAELRQAIDLAVADMPPQCQRVFRMRKIDEMSHASIASELGISHKTVERHMTKAIKLLRERLASQGYRDAARDEAGRNE